MHERDCGIRSLPFRGAVIVFLTVFGPYLGKELAASPHPFAGQTVLLDFYAPWCGPCREMAPVLSELERQGYPVRRVDVDRDRELALQFGVHSLPTFVMLVEGQEAGRLIGGQTIAALTELCRRAPRPASGVAPSEPTTPPARPAITTAAVAASGSSGTNAPMNSADGTGTLPGLMEGVRYAAATEADLTAVTVRIRVADETGRSTGSGTVIDARGGEALILTCGHLFRESQGKAPIRVDLFGPQPVRDLPAELLHYDDRLDLGLITIRPPLPVVAARVAPPGFPLSQGDPIFTVGCNGGDPPTVRQGKITALNRYLGPANIEASGAPVTGRSGGGLFSAEGFLIGVCNAADPQLDEGIYAALKEIHGSLDRMALSFVYRGLPIEEAAPSALPPARSPSVAAISAMRGDVSTILETTSGEANNDSLAWSPRIGRDATGASGTPTTATPPRNPLDRERAAALTAQNGMPLPIPSGDPPLQPVRGRDRTAESETAATLAPPSQTPTVGWNNVAFRSSAGSPSAPAEPGPRDTAVVGSGGLTAEERAALEEIARRRAQGYEIICVVRPTGDAVRPSEVIVLRDASPAFLAALQGSAGTVSDRSAGTIGTAPASRSGPGVSPSTATGTAIASSSGNRSSAASAVLPAVVLPGPVR
ncbi:MAG: trypsin-like peptidase domain-containing protein [Thermogutta sp.]